MPDALIVKTKELSRNARSAGNPEPASAGRTLIWGHSNMPELTYRSAVLADVDSILLFWKQAAEDANRPTDSRDAVFRVIQRDPDALVLATDHGLIVGSLVIGWDGWRCHLYRLAVLPDYRRRGIGTALLHHAEERFLAFGGARADAMVLDANDSAHELWSRAGYTRQGKWSRWVKSLS
jgi:ribosomal protein S18 acetylase RimI-like enzyme